jgi:hypothetical protein
MGGCIRDCRRNEEACIRDGRSNGEGVSRTTGGTGDLKKKKDRLATADRTILGNAAAGRFGRYRLGDRDFARRTGQNSGTLNTGPRILTACP